MKLFVATAVVLIGVSLGIGVAVIAFTGGHQLRHKTQTALLAAMPTIAADELRSRGHQLAAPLACRNIPGHTRRSMRVACSGMTTEKKQVRIIGAAEDKVKREYFTILVNGRPLVQNVNCLGADCNLKKAGKD